MVPAKIMPKIRTQPDKYSCGVYAIINSLLSFGDSRRRNQVEKLTSTTWWGTDEKGIKNALLELGYKVKEYKSRSKQNAWEWTLNNSINYPLILIIDNNTHWVVVSGRIRNKVILIDSKEGVSIVGKKEFFHIWENYAIRIYQ